MKTDSMKQHILIIDDDKDELTIFLDALKKMPWEDGFKCTYASNTNQALEMLRYLLPDFIFVDLNMPQSNGLDFLSTIRNDDKLKNTPVFLYSTAINKKSYECAMMLGAYGCIEKTNTIKELTEKLEAIFIPRLGPVYSLNDMNISHKQQMVI